MTDDIFVRTVKLPNKIRAFTMPGYDGMNVYISEDLDEDQRIKAYRHELRHIVGRDFEMEDVQQIEADAHQEVIQRAEKVRLREKSNY
jgi:hypothetical protein